MRLFLSWLIISIGSIGDLASAASTVFEPREPQANDPDTALMIPQGGTVVVDNSYSLGLGTALQDIEQVAGNRIEGNQEEGLITAADNRCRSPRAATRKRNQPDYCQNVAPPHLQQQENGRPSGNLNQDKPAQGNFISPAQQNLEWAPPLKGFFEEDPCQVRPWQVCAPYVPGLDFRAWASGRLAGFDLEGCDYCMYGHFCGHENSSSGKTDSPQIDSSYIVIFIN